MNSDSRFQQILGVRFFVGDAQGAISKVSRKGCLVVVPAAPALKNLAVDKGYREALLGADFAIADSAFMVLLWNLIDSNRIPKLSGLKYLRALVEEPEFQLQGNTFWVMPTPASASETCVGCVRMAWMWPVKMCTLRQSTGRRSQTMSCWPVSKNAAPGTSYWVWVAERRSGWASISSNGSVIVLRSTASARQLPS